MSLTDSISNGAARRSRRAVMSDTAELENAAAVALIVLRRVLVEGAPVTPEAVTREAAIVFQTDPAEAASRLDAQAQSLGVCGLM